MAKFAEPVFQRTQFSFKFLRFLLLLLQRQLCAVRSERIGTRFRLRFLKLRPRFGERLLLCLASWPWRSMTICGVLQGAKQNVQHSESTH